MRCLHFLFLKGDMISASSTPSGWMEWSETGARYPFCGTIRGKEKVFVARTDTRIEIEPSIASEENHFRRLL
jgi:hypothetical protein